MVGGEYGSGMPSNTDTDKARADDALLSTLPPREYHLWVNVSIGYKAAGGDVETYLRWCALDPDKFDERVARRLFESVDANGAISARTLYWYAMQNGWHDDHGSTVRVSHSTPEPLVGLSPQEQTVAQIAALFEPGEIVNVCMAAAWNEKHQKWQPAGYGTSYERDKLIGLVQNDYDGFLDGFEPKAGAWLCCNPLDGMRRKNECVTAWRHALIESDELPVDDQVNIMLDLGLPISTVTTSGGKSVHALVRVDAEGPRHYAECVEQLHAICNDAGMHVDGANKNAARLTRLAGVTRGGNMQELLYAKIGAPSFDAWMRSRKHKARVMPSIDPVKAIDELVKPNGCETPVDPLDNATATSDCQHKRHKPEFWENKTFLHENMADWLIDEFHACTMHGDCPAIWDSDEGRWRLGLDAWDGAVVRETRGTKITHHKEVAHCIRLKAGDRSMDAGKFSQLIATKNCVLDPLDPHLGEPDSSGGLHGIYENRPEFCITNIINATWDPAAYDDDLDLFLDSISGGDGLVRQNLIEVAASCIYRGREIQQAAFLCGSGGNGKSTYLKVLERFVGPRNYAAIKLQQLGGRFNLAPLVGKTAIIGDETTRGTVSSDALSTFRSLTSKDEIMVEHKLRDLYGYHSYAGLVFAVNSFPRFEEIGDAELDRIFCIPFNVRFRGTQLEDPGIVAALDTENARSFLLNLCIAALPVMVRQRGYTKTGFSSFMRQDVRDDSDVVSYYLESCDLDDVALDGAPVCEQYQTFVAFCDNAGVVPAKRPNRKAFTSRVNSILHMVTKNDGWDQGRGEKVRVFHRK